MSAGFDAAPGDPLGGRPNLVDLLAGLVVNSSICRWNAARITIELLYKLPT